MWNIGQWWTWQIVWKPVEVTPEKISSDFRRDKEQVLTFPAWAQYPSNATPSTGVFSFTNKKYSGEPTCQISQCGLVLEMLWILLAHTYLFHPQKEQCEMCSVGSYLCLSSENYAGKKKFWYQYSLRWNACYTSFWGIQVVNVCNV